MECNAEAQINIQETFVSLLRRAQPSHCGTCGDDVTCVYCRTFVRKRDPQAEFISMNLQ